MLSKNLILPVAVPDGLRRSANILVPWLRLGMHCSRGSASHRIKGQERILVDSAGRACNSVGSKAEPAEPWNQLVHRAKVLGTF